MLLLLLLICCLSLVSYYIRESVAKFIYFLRSIREAIDQLAKYSLLDLRFAQRYYVYIRKLLLEYGIFELFSINVKITVATAKKNISFNINISLTLPIILLCIYFVTAITRFAHTFNKLFSSMLDLVSHSSSSDHLFFNKGPKDGRLEYMSTLVASIASLIERRI